MSQGKVFAAASFGASFRRQRSGHQEPYYAVSLEIRFSLFDNLISERDPKGREFVVGSTATNDVGALRKRRCSMLDTATENGRWRYH